MHISRLGRATPCLFHLEGVYTFGHLREYFLAFWPLPPIPPGQGYVVSGNYRGMPLQSMQLAPLPPSPNLRLSPQLHSMALSAHPPPAALPKPHLFISTNPKMPSTTSSELNWCAASITPLSP